MVSSRVSCETTEELLIVNFDFIMLNYSNNDSISLLQQMVFAYLTLLFGSTPGYLVLSTNETEMVIGDAKMSRTLSMKMKVPLLLIVVHYMNMSALYWRTITLECDVKLKTVCTVLV